MTDSPTPWTSEHYPAYGGDTIIRDANGETVARVFGGLEINPVNAAVLTAAPAVREALSRLVEAASSALATIDAKRKAGDFDHWESFTMGDLGLEIDLAKATLANGLPRAERMDDYT